MVCFNNCLCFSSDIIEQLYLLKGRGALCGIAYASVWESGCISFLALLFKPQHAAELYVNLLVTAVTIAACLIFWSDD